MSHIPYKPELMELVKELALEIKPEGEFFTLKSGAKSNYYLDLRNLHLTPRGLGLVVRILWLEMADTGKKFQCFGGPSIGADPIIGGLCMMASMSPNNYRGFLIRPEAKDHGKGSRIVGPLRPGDNCIIVEDVVTTGGSSMDAIDVVESFGAKVVQAFSVVDRLNGGAEKFAERGIPYKSLLDIREFGLEPV